jgi:hypothetical protein
MVHLVLNCIKWYNSMGYKFKFNFKIIQTNYLLNAQVLEMDFP